MFIKISDNFFPVRKIYLPGIKNTMSLSGSHYLCAKNLVDLLLSFDVKEGPISKHPLVFIIFVSRWILLDMDNYIMIVFLPDFVRVPQQELVRFLLEVRVMSCYVLVHQTVASVLRNLAHGSCRCRAGMCPIQATFFLNRWINKSWH